MTEPARPKLTLVDEAFATLPPAETLEEQKIREGQRKIVARHAGSLVSIAKRRWEAELHQAIGGWTIEQIKARKLNQEAHEAEIDRLTNERAQWVKEGKAHGRYQGVAIAAVILVPLAIVGMFWIISMDRIDDVAAARVQHQDGWTPPEQSQPQGFRN